MALNGFYIILTTLPTEAMQIHDKSQITEHCKNGVHII
jgi:hypothetical protein